jgi:hypothetical protein
VYANAYIDDAAWGCPLKLDLELSNRFFVDWPTIQKGSGMILDEIIIDAPAEE